MVKFASDCSIPAVLSASAEDLFNSLSDSASDGLVTLKGATLGRRVSGAAQGVTHEKLVKVFGCTSVGGAKLL